MARLRLGVVVGLPEPLCSEVDGIRKAIGLVGVGTIHPHITVIPPFNAPESDLDHLGSKISRVAGETEPFSLSLGAIKSFGPTSSVLYLQVEDLSGSLSRLRDRLGRGELPLTIRQERAFVAHVTLADGLSRERIESALELLGEYRGSFEASTLDLLQRHPESSKWAVASQYLLGQGSYFDSGSGRVRIALTRGIPKELEGEDITVTGRIFRERFTRRGGLFCVLAFSSDSLIGYCIYGIDGPISSVARVVVKNQSMLRQSIGTKMMRSAIVHLKWMKANTTYVVEPTLPEEFLKRSGFVLATHALRAEVHGDYEKGTKLYLRSLSSL